ncbi:MAG TPA: hypothetical protein VNZ44_07795, partial [Pyrinomonadaceae bacterium]|nr:hypothetical protein [Pyrinomonadaceae bacterium]
GRIAPRDVGDSRRTRHFYTFRGTEGDLVLNLETSNLIGDVDVYTATTFQPLVKFTLLGDAGRLTKSFYLRGEQSLVLRVEARAVGDAEGTYRVTFGGSFAPAPAELANTAAPPEPTLSGAGSRDPNARRVTSTGARIDEPRAEPTPEEVAAPTPRPTPAARTTTRRGTAASRRNRGTRATTPARPRADTAPARPETAKPESSETNRPEESAAEPRPTPENPDAARATTAPRTTTAPRRRNTRTPARRGSSRTGDDAPRTAEGNSTESAAAPPVAPARRLIIVTKDGETLEQNMSAVRRVTVENNQLVVLLRDGKVIRRPMLDVLRMSIEP